MINRSENSSSDSDEEDSFENFPKESPQKSTKAPDEQLIKSHVCYILKLKKIIYIF